MIPWHNNLHSYSDTRRQLVNVKLHLADTHRRQFWQTLEGFAAVRDAVRQLVLQKIAGEPFLWNAVCPLMRLLLQWEQHICSEVGLAAGARGAPDGITEKTEPILKSSCRERRGTSEKWVGCEANCLIN